MALTLWGWWYAATRRTAGQSRLASLAEAAANVAVGFLLALGLQVVLMHAYGIEQDLWRDLQITCLFTVLSLVRGYVLRRLFNRAHGGVVSASEV